jgi:hypothetical protein
MFRKRKTLVYWGELLSLYVISPTHARQAICAELTAHQDHPIESRPVFFIHPCRTAEVMEVSVGGRDVTAAEYLLLWIGAMGKCVGLDVPFALASEPLIHKDKRETGMI